MCASGANPLGSAGALRVCRYVVLALLVMHGSIAGVAQGREPRGLAEKGPRERL